MFFGLGLGTFFRTERFESIVLGFLAGFFSLRFDIATLYQEAGQLIESKLNQAYDYYAALTYTGAENLYKRKNEESAIRIVFGMFAYPATMNLICVIVLLDLWLMPLTFAGRHWSLAYFFLTTYGTLLPLRRVITIRKLVRARETERKYVALVELLRKEKSTLS